MMFVYPTHCACRTAGRRCVALPFGGFAVCHALLLFSLFLRRSTWTLRLHRRSDRLRSCSFYFRLFVRCWVHVFFWLSRFYLFSFAVYLRFRVSFVFAVHLVWNAGSLLRGFAHYSNSCLFGFFYASLYALRLLTLYCVCARVRTVGFWFVFLALPFSSPLRAVHVHAPH